MYVDNCNKGLKLKLKIKLKLLIHADFNYKASYHEWFDVKKDYVTNDAKKL